MGATKNLVLFLSLMAVALMLCPHAVRAQSDEVEMANKAASLRRLAEQARSQDLSREVLEEERARYRRALDAIYENGFIVDFNSAWLNDLVENWDCRFAEASIRELARRREEVWTRLEFVKGRCRDAVSQTPAVRSTCTRAIRENNALIARFDRMERQYAPQCPATTLNDSASTP
uniref:Lysozyme inhibitor LprI N-terminal domain-containing protein n=1 Tax=Candidatus Kentrum sp. FM TaxID=2126340 RepID=A0A450S990_9GAMM|nr:MAG: hypothetical protein BECKFM1743A_GA0114220_1004512 [Candidatus Kentron sp. FM]VFJ48608.1 MAG: hypothetical protein BECKFM1743C_GA0114222_1006111 [Candidatus Kentron sp. FM]VFK08063.1 MAG: hypothetical protein BECKFM1743B_GA0114221_1005810 [Candidatus Kentron sp. FM]